AAAAKASVAVAAVVGTGGARLDGAFRLERGDLDADADDAGRRGLQDGQRGPIVREGLPRLGDAAEGGDDEAADGVVVVPRGVADADGLEGVVGVLDVGAGVDDGGELAGFRLDADLVLRLVVLVLVVDLAADLLDDVLDGQQAGDAAVLVGDHGDVDLLGQQLA